MTSFLLPLQMPSTKAALCDALSESAEARWISAMALGRCEQDMTDQATDSLVRLAADPVPEVRAQALEGMMELRLSGAEIPEKYGLTALSDPFPCVRCAAVDAALVLTQRPEEAISPMLKDEDPSVRAAAASALGELGAATKVDDIAALLNDESSWVAKKAAAALCEIGDLRGEALLISVLSNAWQDALDAALALGKLGSSSAAPALFQAAGRRFAPLELKAMAAAALAGCGDARGIAILDKLLKGRRSSRMTVLTVIARLPLREMIPALKKLIAEGNDMESSAAEEVLKIIEDAGRKKSS